MFPMNSIKHLETTLRGWVPRKPSPTLKTRIFASAAANPDAPATLSVPVSLARGIWAAPLTATAMLLLSLATAWPPNRTVAGSLSFAHLPSAWEATVTPPVEQNAPPQPTFRSTTQGSLTSSFGSLLLRQTNVFAR